VPTFYSKARRLVSKGETKKALEILNENLTPNCGFMRAYFLRGQLFTLFSEFRKAIEDFTEVINLEASFDEAYIERGIAYSKIDEHEKAIDDFKKSVDINEKNKLSFQINSGIALAEMGKISLAIENFRKAFDLKLDKNTQAIVYSNMGNAYAFDENMMRH
jgi:tetratricopeptide (TPR) repeat protein